MQIKFDNIHKSKKHAFIDGLLSGALVAGYSAYLYYTSKKEKEWFDAWERGWQSGRTSCEPYIDKKLYEQNHGAPFPKE